MTDQVLTPPPHVEPVVFTRDMLDWLPWLEPMAEEALTARHMTALVEAARAKSPYFRLLVRDPDVLEARTLTDKDIFYNPAAGLPRAERELAAAATSRFNGCIYCASVHARFAATYSKRVDDVDRLLSRGRRGRTRAALERDRRRLGGADRHADHLRPGACRRPACRRGSTMRRSSTSSMRRRSSTGRTG